MTIRRLLALLLLVFTAFVSPALAAEGNGPPWREWNPGLAEASTKGRPVLVDVYTDWCGFCKKMDREVYSRADVREYLGKRFVTVKLDAGSNKPGDYEGKTLSSRSIAARFRVNGYPTTVFLSSKGEHLVNVPGYIKADRFLTLLRYVGEGYLERGVSWDDYLKSASAPPAK